ncbi:hypothetical protein AM571_CH00267 [Rhizobium etli 8C-3]|uniref:Uncharacterized protein n=1 Tax=Rhizobium etli 8C-3 TaxID=538025 RepID=A0A1L5NYZ0_RHIET|nr:hypothetical protein AM571_CH00267 [Rhizobium etli 8C-3]
MSTKRRKPPRRMMTFVAIIFLIACAVALIFTWTTHPGDPEGQSPPHAIDQSQ